MAHHSDMEEEDKIYLNIFAPTATAFVEWCIRQAVRSGKKRLYFLARDCHPMYVMALRLCEMYHINIDIRLLSVSRYALRLPEYHLLSERAIDRIAIGGIDVTLRKIFKRAGLTDDEIIKAAKTLNMEKETDKILNYRQIVKLREKLGKCDVFLKYIYEHSCNEYPAAIGYMEQMGMFENIPYGLVDSGWTGTLQQTITNLIRAKKPDFATEGYYFGLYELPKGADAKGYHSFYFSPDSGLRRKVYFSNCLFEAVFSQACGMTLGYARETEGEGYAPKKSKAGNPNSRQLNRSLEVLKEYTDIYGTIMAEMPREKADRLMEEHTAVCERLLRAFMGRPERMAAEIYGNKLFCDDMVEESFLKVARDMTKEDIKNQRLIRKIAIMSGIKSKELHDSGWIEGSIVKAGGRVKRNLWHARAYKYILYIRKRLRK